MDALSSIAVVSFVVVGVVDVIKDLSPKVKGLVTLFVAAGIGALWAGVDGYLGFVPDLSVAQGISAGLMASGVVGTLKKIGG